jgi:hypothetical protein
MSIIKCTILSLLLGLLIACQEPYPGITFSEVEYRILPNAVKMTFEVRHPGSQIRCVHAKEFKDRIVDYRIVFVNSEGQAFESVILPGGEEIAVSETGGKRGG